MEPWDSLEKRCQVSLTLSLEEFKKANDLLDFIRIQTKIKLINNLLRHPERLKSIENIKGKTTSETIAKKKRALEVLIKETL